MGLFPIELALPSGFRYTEEFITEDEERILLSEIEKIPLHTFIFQGYEAKRRVASFGFDYSFENRRLSKGKDIPTEFAWLIEKVALTTDIPSESFAELLITEYPPGAVINWHRDAFPFEIIAGISLLSDCTFKLRPNDKARQGRKAVITMAVRRRSLYIIKGNARWEWEHSTAAGVLPRYSITLRTLGGPR
jgi:alkylated DNA repair dioxygenase AlkB